MNYASLSRVIIAMSAFCYAVPDITAQILFWFVPRIFTGLNGGITAGYQAFLHVANVFSHIGLFLFIAAAIFWFLEVRSRAEIKNY